MAILAGTLEHPERIEKLYNKTPTPQISQTAYSIPSHISKEIAADIRKDGRAKLLENDLSCEIVLDIFPSPAGEIARPTKLVVFDMDSTLIDQEVIDELARSIGKADVVSDITRRAMNGELDFEASLKQRVAMLAGISTDVWTQIEQNITIAEGARELVQTLKTAGITTAVVSGGFMPMALWLQQQLGLDYAMANHVCLC